MSKFNEMGKVELRAACKAAGIAYGKLNNDGMRAALIALENQVETDESEVDEVDEVEGDEEGETNEVKTQPAPAAQSEVKAEAVPTPGPRAKTLGEVVEAKSLKIEKGRPKQNGVTKPSAGSICRAIWDALDAKQGTPGFEDVRQLMVQHGWSRNTAFTQFQRWKQFHGVMPRDADKDAE
jgi:hypothetical protein